MLSPLFEDNASLCWLHSYSLPDLVTDTSDEEAAESYQLIGPLVRWKGNTDQREHPIFQHTEELNILSKE